MVGLGDARTIRAGVVGGSYFEVMGLRPVIGRLLDSRDDGPSAAGAAVLTYRFWTSRSRAIRPCSARRFGSARGRRPSSAARAVRPVSGGNRADRERRHESASSVGDDGDRTRASDDGAVRPPRAGRGSRRRARRAERPCTRRSSASIPSRIRIARTSASTRCCSRSDHVAREDRPVGAARGIHADLRDRLFERGDLVLARTRAARVGALGAGGARRGHRARCGGCCSPRVSCCAERARSSAD